MHNLDQANQEIERLRKHIDKQQAELQGLFLVIISFCQSNMHYLF